MGMEGERVMSGAQALFQRLDKWRDGGINAEDYWDREWEIRPGNKVWGAGTTSGRSIVVTLRALAARKDREGRVIAPGYTFELIEHDYLDPIRNTSKDVEDILTRVIKRMERTAAKGDNRRGLL